MKKILLLFLLAATSLQGWADEYYLVGGCTDSGWSTGEYSRSAVRATQTGANTYAWAGKLKAYDSSNEDGTRFKIPKGNNYDNGIWASVQNQHLTETPSTIEYANNGDKKFCVSEDGYYLVSFNTSTSTITAKKLKEPSKDGDYYLISSTDDYYWFAGYIASNDTKTAKARLNEDISFEGKDFVCLASDKYKFMGEFDGNGHTIDYAVVRASSYGKVGLFTYLAGEAYIHDLIMGENCSFTGTLKVGGISGYARDGGEVTLTNIINKANVTSSLDQWSNGNEGNSAGLIACATDNTIITATNCGNMGTVRGQDGQCAAFAGWTQDRTDNNVTTKTTFTNCWNSGDIYNIEDSAQLYRNSGSVNATNCFDLTNKGNQGTKVDAAKIATGEFCYILNGDQSNIVWYQNLSENKDEHPFPFNTQGTVSKSNTSYTNLTVINDYVQINEKEDLYTFSAEVSNGQTTLNAELKDDIVTDNSYIPIGTGDNKYKGNFNGNKHIVTLAINDNTRENQGLIGVATTGANIHDLVVDGSVTAKKRIAGIVGYATGGGTITLTNVINKANVDATGNDQQQNAAGLVGCGDGTAITATNCANMGSVKNSGYTSGTQQCAAFAGWTSSGTTFTNCWNSGTISNYENTAILYRNTGQASQENCYHVTDDDFTPQYGTKIGTITVTSGELCYKLNGSANAGTNWYQTLDTDNYPVPFDTHEKIYYVEVEKCDGSGTGEQTYNNSSDNVVLPHEYEEGWCTECNAYEENAFSPIDGWYQISTAKQLRWMAESVNEYNSTYKNANIKLTADIDYSAYTNQAAMIGKESKTYKGTFDGQFHTVTVAFNNTSADETGLVQRMNGGTIKNLRVDGTIDTNKKLAAGICSGIWETGTITNCWSNVTITDAETGDATHGGIVAHVKNNTNVNITHCLFSGEINAPNRTGSGALVGWADNENDNIKINHCLVVGDIDLKGNSDNDIVCRRNATTSDNYFTCDISKVNNNRGAIDASSYVAGELCYLLNESTCYDVNWTQTLGTDTYPVPFNTHGIVNKISAAGYTTQYIPTTDVTIPDGVEAYTGVILSEGWLHLNAIENGKIAAGEAVILKGNEEGYYSFMPTTDAEKVEGNDLKGSDGTITGDDGIYALAKKGNPAVVGFYSVKSGVPVPAGKVYLDSNGSLVKVFKFVFDDDDATGINSPLLTSPEEEGQVYNLAGQRISKLQKGINIINGKKVLK